jgi:RNA polymerase sigma factor (sigma-70 family)
MSEDLTLLTRWRTHGDAEAFSKIAERHAGMVYGTCRRILRNAEDAEDVAQECFLRLARDSGRITLSVAGWLHWLATHRALDRLKSEKCRAIREEQYTEIRQSAKDEAWSSVEPLIDEAIAALPDPLREAVVRHFFEGQSHKEIADELNVTRSAVTHQIHRGIEGIRKHLNRAGVSVGAGVLVSLLTTHAAEAAPASLLSVCARIAVSGLPRSALEASAAAGKAALLGGVIVMNKLTLTIASALFLVAVFFGYLLLRGADAVGPWNSDTNVIASSGESPVVLSADSGTLPDTPPGASANRLNDGAEADAGSIGELPDVPIPSPAEQVAEPMATIGTISGWVVDSEGEPIADAAVFAGGDAGRGETTSGDDGTFTIDIDAPASRHQDPSTPPLFYLQGNHADYSSITKLRIPLDSDDVELVLLAQGGIQGYVFNAVTGDPITEFQAKVSRHRTPFEGIQNASYPWTSFSSPEGEFTLMTEYDTTEVSVQAEGFGLETVDLYAAQGETLTGLAVGLQPGGDVQGIVRDAKSREPIAGASVAVAVGTVTPGHRDADATTGSDGRFKVEGKITTRTVDLRAWHTGYSQAFLFDNPVGTGRDIEFLLTPGGTLKGLVLRAGVPQPGLRVHATMPFGLSRLPDIAPADQFNYQTWTGTGSDGRYEFSGLPFGRYLMRIIDASPSTPLENRYLLRKWVEIEDGKTVELIHELGEYSVVQGTIVGPLSFENVVVSLRDARYPTETIFMTGEKHGSNGPDEFGVYHFPPVPAGEYLVRVELADDPGIFVDTYCTLGQGESLSVPIDFPVEPETSGEDGAVE